MVGYNIFRNDERLCVAGVGDFGVLTACVTWSGRNPDRIARLAADSVSDKPVALTLHVGGLRSGERDTGLHMRWVETNLQVGDEIRIQVTDVAHVDPAIAEYRDEPASDLERKRRHVRDLAKELGWEIRESC
jgi:hypothetical protein